MEMANGKWQLENGKWKMENGTGTGTGKGSKKKESENESESRAQYSWVRLGMVRRCNSISLNGFELHRFELDAFVCGGAYVRARLCWRVLASLIVFGRPSVCSFVCFCVFDHPPNCRHPSWNPCVVLESRATCAIQHARVAACAQQRSCLRRVFACCSDWTSVDTDAACE